MRGFFKDRAVREHKLTKDTRRRILQFARPYRGKLAIFVGLIALEAAAGAVTPLLFKNLIDNGITPGNTEVVIRSPRRSPGLAHPRRRACPSPTAGCRRRWARA